MAEAEEKRNSIVHVPSCRVGSCGVEVAVELDVYGNRLLHRRRPGSSPSHPHSIQKLTDMAGTEERCACDLSFLSHRTLHDHRMTLYTMLLFYPLPRPSYRHPGISTHVKKASPGGCRENVVVQSRSQENY